MERLKLFDEPFSILLLSIQNLEGIKENVGHIAAQRLIQGIARLTRSRLKTSDVIGRYSPDTILAVLPRTDSIGAGRLEERLARELSREDILKISKYPGECEDFAVKAGTAQAEQDLKLNDVVELAQAKLKVLGPVYCEPQQA